MASSLGLSYALTDDVRVIYSDPTLAPFVPHAVRTFHNSAQWQRRIFGWQPADLTTLWLRDFSDYGNANASPAPRNLLRLDVAPVANPFETSPGHERFYTTMNHELVHIANGDVADTRDRFWRHAFSGKVTPQSDHPESLLYSLLTTPRWAAPRWYLEGAAVFMETWMAGGQGRAQGGYDEMVFRAMVRDDAPFYTPLGLASRATQVDFQVGAAAYLYGTRFFTWLAWAHSPEQVVRVLRRDEDSRALYAAQFEHVFGEPLEAAWQRWIADERRFQQANLTELRRHPVTPTKPLVAQPLGSVSRGFIDDDTGELIAGVRRPGTLDHIAAIDLRTGASRPLAGIRGAMLYSVTSLAYDPQAKTVLYTTDNNGLRGLWATQLDTGRQTELLKGARIGAIALDPSDRALIGVRHENGRATLVQVPYPYQDWQDLYAFEYGVVPGDLDVSPDGTLLSAAVADSAGEQTLRVYRMADLRAGRLVAVSSFSFTPAAAEGFAFSPDGRYLYGSAYYTGVSNIYRFEVATGRVDLVSNAETGFFRPIPRPDGSLVVFEYTGQGFAPVVIEPGPLSAAGAIRFLGAELAQRHPVVATWQVPAANTVDDEALVRERGVYEPLEQIRLLNLYPVAQGYRDTAGVGLRANFGDPLGLVQLGVTAAITPGQGLPTEERSHLLIDASYREWSATLAWNRSSFYDLFGPRLRGRRGLEVSLGHERLLIYERPRTLAWKTRLSHYSRLDALPGAQNIEAPFDRLLVAETGLHYSDLRRSLGAVDDEKGVITAGTLTASRANGHVVTQPMLRFDAGLPLPLSHTSLWSRTALGGTAGTRSLSIGQYYFGAFGNNRVDDGAVRRYREPMSMPGFGIDAIAARSFVRQMVELNLPPAVFESAGSPDLHLQSLRSSVFAAGLWADPADAARRQRYASLGAQVDLRVSVLHWYDLTLSIGYATGWRGRQHAGSEWMVSLKVF